MNAPGPTPPATGWFDAEDSPTQADLNTCIHCGLCLTACPTYRELKLEPDSPRGRIYLMRGLAEGRIAPSDELVGHLDGCLDCRACETVCPAGVPYGRMLEQTRGQLERRRPAGGGGRMLGRFALVALFPNRGLMHTLADLLRLTQSGPLAAIARAMARRGWLPGFAARGLELTPPIEPRASRNLATLAERLPVGAWLERRGGDLVFHPAGNPKARVAFFTSCVMDVMFSHINHEAVRLMVLAGAEVTVPGGQTCCGALHAHSGLRWDAMRLATLNVHAFAAPAGPSGTDGTAPAYDFIVTDSAGCGAALRDSGHLLAEGVIAPAAAAFAAKVRDVSEVLATLGMPASAQQLASPGGAERPLRIAYHDPCHLAHAQKVRSQPRALLAALPGVQCVDLPNSDWCCGSAGVYNLTHEAMADAQLAGKLDSIASVHPDIVVASNPGCLLHMARGARERGEPARMLHLVEVLALAYPAPGDGAHATILVPVTEHPAAFVPATARA